MSKSEFIAWLLGVPGDPEVLAWHPGEQDWAPVTHAMHDVDKILLCTDDQEGEGDGGC